MQASEMPFPYPIGTKFRTPNLVWAILDVDEEFLIYQCVGGPPSNPHRESYKFTHEWVASHDPVLPKRVGWWSKLLRRIRG